MWKILALVVHILMIGYISMIYFQSTVINGMNPQVGHRDLGLEPPADRLVVFITNGFRAESFFQKNCSTIPRLQKIFMEQGLVGVSRSSAPTQSRPGNIAIFGGFQEDPSAALTNFQRNPTTFDTVFNRTMGGTWGWGYSEIADVVIDLPFGEQPINFELHQVKNSCDEILKRVRDFLSSSENVQNAKDKTTTMFLVNLNDLYLVGHYEKPNSPKFLKKVNDTQRVIADIYELFERSFKDNRTVYLMTSDHGMTDHGSHGGSTPLETQLPLFLWGSSVERAAQKTDKQFVANDKGVKMPYVELDQTQLAPLMSAFIGLPPPMNNMAVLPLGFMKVNQRYEAHAMHVNALQLVAQAEIIMENQYHDRIDNWLPTFEDLDQRRIREYTQNFYRQMRLGCSEEAIQLSRDIIKKTLEFLDYHRNYYRIPLLLANIATYLGWFYYLVAKQSRPSNEPKEGWTSVSMMVLYVFEMFLGIFCYLHRVPCWTSFFLMLPLMMWTVALHERGENSPWVVAPFIQIAWIIGTTSVFIATCFYHECICLGYVLIVCLNNRHVFAKPSWKFCVWLLLVAILVTFTIKRPDIGFKNKYILYSSMILTVMRPLVLNESHRWRVWLTNAGGLLLGFYCVEQFVTEGYVSDLLHAMAWAYTIYALISIPYSKTTTPQHRVQLILFNLSTIYTLLCMSYESIFIQVLCTEFILGLEVHYEAKESEEKDKVEEQQTEQTVEDEKPSQKLTPTQLINVNYRYAVLILFYAMMSMFGTGNLININSFDPSAVRVFVTKLCPFVVGALIVLKLFIPTIIIMCIMYAFCAHARRNVRGIFISLLLICDVMCLYFLFLVRNCGSWSEVRQSLSYLIIVHGMPMLFIIFSWVPQHFLSAIPQTMLPMLRWKDVVEREQPDESFA